MTAVEKLTSNGELLACVIRREFSPEKTTFLTESKHNFQVGIVTHPAGHAVARHVHCDVARNVRRTSELLVVRQGRCAVEVYDDARKLAGTFELGTGDAVFFLGGGHGVRMLENTELLEIKQGPYAGPDEKERF